jgi:D-glycero-D-manno-heptose 1,7-bisphosphate phosphatase
MNRKPAVFFDRDGVINLSPGAGYVLSWEAFHWAPGILEALKLCKKRGYLTVVVTSQQAVGKGLMTQATLDDIHQRMQSFLAQHDAAFDAIHACTCLATDAACPCRKPSAWMIQKAAAELPIDLSGSLLIGDQDRDIQMAHNAGIPTTIRILTHYAPQTEASHTLGSTCELAATLDRLL